MQLGEWKRRTTAASFSFKSAQADSSKFTVAMCHAASTASAAYKVCADQDTCSHLACEEAERRPSTGLLIKANNYSPLVSCSAVFFFDEQGIRSKQRKNTGQMLLTESFFFLISAEELSAMAAWLTAEHLPAGRLRWQSQTSALIKLFLLTLRSINVLVLIVLFYKTQPNTGIELRT